MKKVLGIIILVACLGCFIYTTMLVTDTKKDNKKIKKNIQDVTTKIETLTKDNSTYTKEIEELQKKNQSKDEEFKIWEKAKEKLKKALS